ncbi:MAG: BspA family leucine-rich repeat surface protein, partial [Sphaerochaeta sp.]
MSSGIPLSSGFNVNTQLPLELKKLKETLEDRDAIPLIQRYLGLEVYVSAENQFYVLEGGYTNAHWRARTGSRWMEVGTMEKVYTDWYLPSRGELEKVYENLHLHGVGNYEAVNHWSSTEDDADSAWAMNFMTGVQSSAAKTSSMNIIPVRDFTSTGTYALREHVAGGLIYHIEELDFGVKKYYVARINQAEVRPLVLRVNTSLPGTSTDTQYYLNQGIGPSEEFDYTVERCDEAGNVLETISTTSPSLLLAWDAPGEYIIKIYPQADGSGFPSIYHNTTGTNFYGYDSRKVTEVLQWGSVNYSAIRMNGCQNLEGDPIDIPNISQSLVHAFSYCNKWNPASISYWNVSAVTSMFGMFSGCTSFNQDISGWNVSSVTSMFGMFSGCTSFNQDISGWNVSSVTNMGSMFFDCTAFNQPLNSWDVSLVTDMRYMFSGCTSFNQDISGWNVSAVTSMVGMFFDCTAFDQPLNSWDVSSVTAMGSMFNGCTAFDQPLNSWDVSSVTNMERMFSGCTVFNQPLNSWDVSFVTNMYRMFLDCTAFDQP